MTMNAAGMLRAAAFGLAEAAILFGPAGPSSAAEAYTAKQRAACMPDAIRLCGGEIPSVPAIVACMRRNRSNLGAACQAVFPD